MIDLYVETVIVATATIGPNPVVQRIISSRPNSHVGQWEILHHLERHGVYQVARRPWYLIGRAHQIRVSWTHVSGQIVEGNVVAADRAAQAAAVGACHWIPKLAASRGTSSRRIERAAGASA